MNTPTNTLSMKLALSALPDHTLDSLIQTLRVTTRRDQSMLAMARREQRKRTRQKSDREHPAV